MNQIKRKRKEEDNLSHCFVEKTISLTRGDNLSHCYVEDALTLLSRKRYHFLLFDTEGRRKKCARWGRC